MCVLCVVCCVVLCELAIIVVTVSLLHISFPDLVTNSPFTS